MSSPYMTIVQASKYANCSRPTIMRMISDGLKVARIGSRLKIKTTWIDTYMEDKANTDNSTKSIAKNILEGLR